MNNAYVLNKSPKVAVVDFAEAEDQIGSSERCSSTLVSITAKLGLVQKCRTNEGVSFMSQTSNMQTSLLANLP